MLNKKNLKALDFSLNKLKNIISKKDVSMANGDEVKINTGFSIGGVAPIAHLKKLNILIDQSLGRFQVYLQQLGTRIPFLKLNMINQFR